MKRNSLVPRIALTCAALVGLALPAGRGGNDEIRSAHAGPPSSTVWIDAIPHIPAAAKGPKPEPTAATKSDDKPKPSCVKDRYDALTAKIPSLREKFAGDELAFEAGYAAEKEALVSDKALDAAGCK